MSNAQNKARETRRLKARLNFLANEIARVAFDDMDDPQRRGCLGWMADTILAWAKTRRQLRVRRAKKDSAK